MTRIFKLSYMTLIYAFLYFPIAVIVWFSFNNSAHSLIWHGFSWQWYQTLIHDDALILVTAHSLLVGILAATLATLLGALAAICLLRYRFFGGRLLYGVLVMSIIIPDIILAISLLLLFRITHFPLGFWSLLLAHVTFCLPFVFVTANGRLAGFNPHIVEAAQDLGAKDSTIFFRIFIPLLLPALISGWLLSFTLSIDDVIISYFVTGPSFEILPLTIYSMVRLGVSPEINALCSVLFVFTLFMVLIAHRFLKVEKT